MLTQFEMDSITKAVYALQAIADELRKIRELKTQEVKESEKKLNSLYETRTRDFEDKLK